MSKTDKTRPWRVRMSERNLAFDFDGESWPKWWVGEARCGCATCTDQDGRKAKARKDRREGKRMARGLGRVEP